MSGVEGSAPGRSAGRDVLARLAARAVGRGAAARPRPRSRFEVAAGATRHGGVPSEGIDTTAGLDDDMGAALDPATTTPLGLLRRRATGAVTMSNTSAGAGADDRPTAGSSRSTGADDGAGSGPTPGTAPGHTPGAHDHDPGARALRARTAGSRPDPTGASSAGTPLGADRPVAEGPFDRDHLGVVAARPAGRASPTLASLVRAGDEPGPTGGAADRAPVVQIHIGRLDVRANLEAASAAAPPAPAPTEPGLSLTDYLAGKRGTR